jgi:hypothetical protein
LFKNRWKHALSERKAQNLAMNRAQSMTSTNLILFFEMCQKYYDNLEIHDKPHNLYNVDESGFSGDQGGLKI